MVVLCVLFHCSHDMLRAAPHMNRETYYQLGPFYTGVENAALAGVKNAPTRAVLHER